MKQYTVTGMSCAACSARVEKAVAKVPGVSSCSVSLLTNSMGVEGEAKASDVIAAVEAAGYGAAEKGLKTKNEQTAGTASQEEFLQDKETPKLKKRLILSLVFLLPLMYISMGHMMWNWPVPAFIEGNHVAMGLIQLLFTTTIMAVSYTHLDPGESRFYISLEDDLLRLFGSEKLMGVFNALGVADGEQIEHKMLSGAIEKAQKKIENNNFGIRKNLLEYDQVMNEQREIIYGERRRVLDGESMRDTIYNMITEYAENTADRFASSEADPEDWDLKGLEIAVHDIIPQLVLPPAKELTAMQQKELKHLLKEKAVKAYEAKEAEFPEAEQIREIERVVLLKVIDARWMAHIDDMDQLRQGIGLQAYGQRDPLVEYKMMGYNMFGEMTGAIAETTIRTLFHIRVEQKVEREEVAKVTGTNKDESSVRAPKRREEKKIYPNDPCPCGSGKKYKQCCGRK